MQTRTDSFEHTYREPAAYRDDRLQVERERLERRLAWAFRRGDARAVERIRQRLTRLEADEFAELTPGRRSMAKKWEWLND